MTVPAHTHTHTHTHLPAGWLMGAGPMSCLAVHCGSGTSDWLLVLSHQSIGQEYEQKRRGRVHCALTTYGNNSSMKTTGEKGKPRKAMSLCNV